MKPFLFCLASVLFGSAVLASTNNCNHSFWTWQGGERVKVCCNQQNFCTTKYGVYNQ